MARLGTETLGTETLGKTFAEAIATTVSIQSQQSANQFSVSQSGLGPIDAQTALDGTGLSQQFDGAIENIVATQSTEQKASTTVSNAIVDSQIDLLVESAKSAVFSNDNRIASDTVEFGNAFTEVINADLSVIANTFLSNDVFTRFSATGGLVPMIHMEFSNLFTEFRTRNNITPAISESNDGVTSNTGSNNENIISSNVNEFVITKSATTALDDNVLITAQADGNERLTTTDGDIVFIDISNTTLGQSIFGTRRFNDSNIRTGIGFSATRDTPQTVLGDTAVESEQFTSTELPDNIVERNAILLAENLFTTASATKDLLFNSQISIGDGFSVTDSIQNLLEISALTSEDTFTIASAGSNIAVNDIIDGVGFSQVFDTDNDIFAASNELGIGFSQSFDGRVIRSENNVFGLEITRQFSTPGIENVVADSFGRGTSAAFDGDIITAQRLLAQENAATASFDGVIVPVASEPDIKQIVAKTDVVGGLVPMIHMEFSSLFTAFRTRNRFISSTSETSIGVASNTASADLNTVDINSIGFEPSNAIIGVLDLNNIVLGPLNVSIGKTTNTASAGNVLFVLVSKDPTFRLGQSRFGLERFAFSGIFTGSGSATSQRVGEKPTVDSIEITEAFSSTDSIGVQPTIASDISFKLFIGSFDNRNLLEGVFDVFDIEPLTASIVANNIQNAQSEPFIIDAISAVLDADNILDISSLFLEGSRRILEWALGQRQLGTTIEETREYESLELSIRYRKSRKQQLIREILDTSQKSQLLERSGGGFKTVDTGDNTNALDLRAPTDRIDLRSVDEWYLADYERELVDRDGEVYNLDLELNPAKNKAYDNEYGTFDSAPTESIDEAVWNFEFEFGNFNTRQVSVNYNESPTGTLETNEISMILTQEQARIVEENASQLNTVRARTVPDSTDVIDDTSVDERHTVSISPPGNNDEPIPQDEYVIRSWSTEWSGKVFEFTMEVSK